MPRPTCCRRVSGPPRCRLFKPAGACCASLPQIALAVDELEALRLADLQGLHQEPAAERMGVSRATFGRIVESARHKVAQALIEGRALRIEGGTVEIMPMRKFQCHVCQDVLEVPHGAPRPAACPKCGSAHIHREADDRGWGGGRRGRCGGQGGRGGHGRCRRGAGAGLRRGIALVAEKSPPQAEERNVP